MTERFGFAVRRTTLTDYGELFTDEHGTQRRPARVDYAGWEVDLPHQCDEWDITAADKESAIAEMERFVAEAQEALAALREEREIVR